MTTDRRAASAALALTLLTLAPAGLAAPVDLPVEEARVARVRSELPELAGAVTVDALTGVGTPAAARAAGERLWRQEVARVRGGTLDDRPLYWSRLASRARQMQGCAAPVDCAAVRDAFEYASRGTEDLAWTSDAPLHVLVTGFDPFFLDRDIGQSNPSGVAALALDGAVLEANGRRAEVQTLIVPVRYRDFDEGRIEALVGPVLARIDLLVTISMGREDFDIERFPGRRRSAKAPDNENVYTGADAAHPLVPRLGDAPLPGPEFVEFSLPAAAMTSVQTPYPVHDHHGVATLERGRFDAASLAELADQTAVSGSGGGYLSNEISFRTVRLVRARGLDLPVGHLHTPRIRGHDAAALAAITGEIRRILEAAIAAPGQDAGGDAK